MNVEKVEKLYVREVYEKLAAQQSYINASAPAASCESKAGKPWPNVLEFLKNLAPGSLIIDAGCGQLKFGVDGCFRIGFDICSEALLHSRSSPYHDVILADGLHLPFRRECADAALCVSVLHHLSSAERRLCFLRNVSRTLRPADRPAAAPGAAAPESSGAGRMIVYVWAEEQAYARFPSQDVLVPWNLHEIPKNGLMPLVAYHKDSTKEQRIISNSIAINVVEGGRSASWLSQLLWSIQRKLFKIERQIPNAVPQFLREKKVEGITKVISGINRWSPMLGSHLKLALVSVEDLYASELSLTLIEDALAIVLSTLQEITYYRYYHVFRQGELEGLIAKDDSLDLVSLLFRERNTQIFGDSTIFEWRPGGNNIAVGGTNGLVRIYSRYGDVIEEFSINDSVSTINWDKDGELLAITNVRSPTLVLYEFSVNNVQTMDISVGAKNTPTFVCWSPTQPILLVGDNRGNVTMYNHRTSRKTPIMGKHQRAIQSGAFNDDGSIFALGSDDMTITISNAEGDTLQTFSCNGEMHGIRITKIHLLDDAESDKPEDFLSAIVGHKNLMMVKLSKPENPTNLQFQEKYGDIVTTEWYGNGNVLVGFSMGYIVAISTEKATEVSQEVFSVQEFKGHLSSLTVNSSFGKLFAIGDNLLKVRDLYDLKELTDMVDVDSDDKGLSDVSVCEDGSLTAVSSKSGSLSIYLTKLPLLAAAYQSCVGVLSSLTEITIYRDVETQPYNTLNLKLEPSIIAVGPNHIAAVLNHRAWFYHIKRNVSTLVYEHDYMTTVSKLKLNKEYVMAKLDTKVQLHKLPKTSTSDSLNGLNGSGNIKEFDTEDSRLFPDSAESTIRTASGTNVVEIISDAELSEKFFIYCTNLRYIYYYSLANERIISDFKHICEIRQLFAETEGIRLCFIDERHDTYVYNPVDDLLTQIPSISPLLHYKGCLWETFTIDRDSLVVFDASHLYVFVVSMNAKREQVLNQLSTLPIPYGSFPLMLSKGIVFCNTQNGRVNTILLKSHKTDSIFDGKSQHDLFEMLNQALTLKRWRNAWRVCEYLKENSAWKTFSRAALEDMNIDLAIRIFRFIGDVAMVWTLEELLFTEDQNVLAGHVAALLGQFDEADELFCRSSCPIDALNMRRDIQHWDRALELAQNIAPAELPSISREYAVQLELLGKHEDALRHYEQALTEFLSTRAATTAVESLEPSGEDEQEAADEHKWLCKSGIARMTLRTGDLQRGVQTAVEIPNRLIKRECGLILEQMKQFEEAGRLYEAGEFYDRAVASFLRCKNWIKINELIGHVRSPKILSQYAKILVNDKKYEKAFETYKKALDYDNMIRLLLKHLNRPEEAIRLVQESRSIEGAKMVAKFFTDLGNNESAIEFLVLSQCYQEAYELAESQQCMSVYANAVESTGNIQLFTQLAEYFSEDGGDLVLSGKFAGLAKNYSMALDNLIKASSGKISGDDLAAQYAVEFAAESSDKLLIYKLIDFLMGETDGIPKDPKYLFQLYVRLKMYAEAAKTAVIIAQDQQNKGFYKAAHDLLFEMYKTLRDQKIRIPAEMENGLQLLHSYNIIKGLIKRGENLIAARLLIRVSTNISQFPIHSAQILTSAVITCTKAGLKASAFKFASQLLQPALRNKIDEKYKKKIETVVRKSERDAKDAEDEETRPCPYCAFPVSEFSLTCGECKSTMPYCIVTGRHVTANDFALCPSCLFPGYYSAFNKLIQHDGNCPMCHKKIDSIVPNEFESYTRLFQNEK